MKPTPDWQLPIGIDRGLWNYLHNRELARTYDASLEGTPLLEVDLAFADRLFVRPGSLVDLGCGTGRLMLRLAARGFDCTGIDLSPGMLEEVRRKAVEAGVAVATLQANLAELDGVPDDSFDDAACLFSTLGMLRGRPARQAFLAHVRRIVRPGGRFLLHVHHRHFYLGNPAGLRWFGRDLIPGRDGDRTMPQTWGGSPLTLHHFRKREIVRDLTAAGWKIAAMEPLSIRRDGRQNYPRLLGRWRTYGWLIVCE